jgi:UDP-N-acetylmuramate dehydrogenase
VTNRLVIEEYKDLGPLTSLKIGGPARYFARAVNEFDLIDALEFAEGRSLQVFILGGGSNILVSDEGFDGLVIQVGIDRSLGRLSSEESNRFGGDVGGKRRITAGAGENWDDFVAFCVANDLAGVECLSGIPGSVGGTPVQNVGAYGQEVSETIVAVRCIDRRTLQPVRLTNEECGFEYRKSIFNSNEADRYVIYDVTFELKPGGEPKVEYKDLVDHFRGRRPSLAEIRGGVLAIRRTKSMVIDPEDPNCRSVGSFFKNPVIPISTFNSIEQTSASKVPHFPVDAENIKIPAAWLIENTGFNKGFRTGNVGISSQHPLALVNLGGAKATELVRLKDQIVDAVLSKFGIALVPEPVFLGFDVADA